MWPEKNEAVSSLAQQKAGFGRQFNSDDMHDNKSLNRLLLIPVILLNPGSRVGLGKRCRTTRIACDLVYPFLWNHQGDRCSGLRNLTIEYEEASAGWGI